MARLRTVHSVTVEIAGLVCGIKCRHLKPICWARESHPAFLSTKGPDIDLTLVYSEEYWRRGLPWIAQDTVADAPVVSRPGQQVVVRTAYYRAQIDLGRGLSKTFMASGFRVHGLMRMLYTLFLIPRGAIVVRGVRVATDRAAYLLCGLSAHEKTRLLQAVGDLPIFDGFLIVIPRDGSYAIWATPFHDGETPLALQPETPLSALYLCRSDAEPAQQRLHPAMAMTQLFPHMYMVNHDPSAIDQVLESSAQLVKALPCYQGSGVPSLSLGSA